jgi:hypothetical protein
LPREQHPTRHFLGSGPTTRKLARPRPLMRAPRSTSTCAPRRPAHPIPVKDHMTGTSHPLTSSNAVLTGSDGPTTRHEARATTRVVAAFLHDVRAVLHELLVLPHEVLQLVYDVVVSLRGPVRTSRRHHLGRRHLLATACFVLGTTNDDVSRTSHGLTRTFELLRTPRNAVAAACFVLRT